MTHAAPADPGHRGVAGPGLGIGIGWRAAIDLTVARLPGVDFVEVVAENVAPDRAPATLLALRARGVPVVPHGVSLSLGGAARPDRSRLSRLAPSRRSSAPRWSASMWRSSARAAWRRATCCPCRGPVRPSTFSPRTS